MILFQGVPYFSGEPAVNLPGCTMVYRSISRVPMRSRAKDQGLGPQIDSWPLKDDDKGAPGNLTYTWNPNDH